MTEYCIYILASRDSSVMYVGVTGNLERGLYEHKRRLLKGFSSKYSTDRLVYFEVTGDVTSAIAREKQIKSRRREKKNALGASLNPEWKDLSLDWYVQDPSSLRSVGMTING